MEIAVQYLVKLTVHIIFARIIGGAGEGGGANHPYLQLMRANNY